MADVQARVQSLLYDLIEQDIERGLQVAACLDGELVVDAWAGLANAETDQPVGPDTLFCVFSCTKGITATVIHMLVERGLLDIDTPVSHYWPEFGRNGKASITLRQVLTHSAGVPQVPDGIGPAESCNWERACRAVAELTPLWEPGTRTGYHAVTFGWILGEVARRVDGRPFSQIVMDEIARPLGIEDMHVGIPDDVEEHVALIESLPATGDQTLPPPDALIWRAIPPSFLPLDEWANRPDVRRACVPASNGITTARSLARFYAALIPETADSSLLSPAQLRIATALQTREEDAIMGSPARKALGYFLGGDALSPMGTRLSSFGHAGAGGSIGFADPDYGLAFALAKTRMVTAEPGQSAAYLVAHEVRDALGIPD